MVYKDFQGLKLSALGLGAMRLPVINGEDSRIDENAVMEMVDCAMEQGINYYDTAWGYHGGNSEIVIGKALGRYPRENFYLATKFLIWERWKKFLKNSWKNAVWIILIFICSIMYAR